MLLLAKVDLFGTPATLNIFGNPKKKSKFGGFCSILFFGFVIWAIYNGVRKLFDRDIPTIVASNLTTEDPRRINFSSEAFPMTFIVQAPLALGSAGFTNESIYTLEAQLDMLERIPLPNGTVQRKWTYTKLETEPCTQEYFGEYASSFTTFTFQGSHCISKNQPAMQGLELRGVFASALFKSLRVQVVACDPNKTNVTGVTCGTQAEINKYLAGSTFTVMYMNNVMHLQNYSYPTAKFRDSYAAMMSPAYYKETTVEIGYVEVSTDAGWLTETTHKQNTLQINKISENFDPTAHTDKVIMACLFQSGRIENYFTRTYIKIPAVLAEIGGLANAVLGILLILVTPYLKVKSREALMHEIFEVKEKPKQKNKEPAKKINNKSKKKEDNNPHRRSDPEKESLKLPTSPNILELPTLKFSNSEHNQTGEQILKVESSEVSPNLRQASSGIESNGQQTFSNANAREKMLSSENMHTKLSENAQSYLPEQKIAQDTMPVNKNQDKADSKEGEQLNIVKFYQEQKFDSKNNHINNDDFVNDHSQKEEDDVAEVKLGIDVAMEVSDRDQDSTNKNTKKKINPTESHLQVWEYVMSLVYTPKSLKSKIELIEEGVKTIEEKLDVNYILQRLVDLEKLIVILLDENQRAVFKNVPKPYLHKKLQRQAQIVRKNTALIEEANKEQFLESYKILEKKPNKTDVDNRLIEICSRKFTYI